MKVVVMYGSVREGRQGIKGARFVVEELKKRQHEVELLDPMEKELPLLNKMYKEFSAGEAPPVMEGIATSLKNADAIIVVSAEYNHSIPPALKNMLDHFQKEYFWKPAGIVTYSAGGFGGVRAGVHLRVILSELGLVTLPTMFPLSKVQSSFDESGKALDEVYVKRITKFLDELEWYAAALKAGREKGVPY